MRLARSPLLGGWALVDEACGVLRHAAGALWSWSPRIASGEGRAALPLTGKVAAIDTAEPLAADGFRRLHPGPCEATRSIGLAAVIGCSLVGRANPFRSVLGYVGVAWDGDQPTFGRFLVTRDEFGDLPPSLSRSPTVGVTASEHLEAFACDLQPADVLLLGPVDLTDALRDRLWGHDARVGSDGRPSPPDRLRPAPWTASPTPAAAIPRPQETV